MDPDLFPSLAAVYGILRAEADRPGHPVLTADNAAYLKACLNGLCYRAVADVIRFAGKDAAAGRCHAEPASEPP
jgi:hypothetical protein